MTDQHPGPYDADPTTPSPAAPDAAGEGPTDDDRAAYWRRPVEQPGAPAAPPEPPAAPSSSAPAPPSTPPPTGTSSTSDEGAGDGDADFDAWLTEFTRQRPTVTIYGERWPIPIDVPLWITSRVEQGDANLETLRLMIDALYGVWTNGTLEVSAAARWIDRGAGEFALGTILAWTMLRTQGRNVSFAEATAEAERMGREAEAQRAQQKERTAHLERAAAAGAGADSHEARAEAAAIEAVAAAGKAPSSGTGAPLRPTSAGSTASTGPAWRG